MALMSYGISFNDEACSLDMIYSHLFRKYHVPIQVTGYALFGRDER